MQKDHLLYILFNEYNTVLSLCEKMVIAFGLFFTLRNYAKHMDSWGQPGWRKLKYSTWPQSIPAVLLYSH